MIRPRPMWLPASMKLPLITLNARNGHQMAATGHADEVSKLHSTVHGQK